MSLSKEYDVSLSGAITPFQKVSKTPLCMCAENKNTLILTGRLATLCSYMSWPQMLLP